MTSIQYLAVFIRLFAVFLFLYSLTGVGYLIEFLLHGTYRGIQAGWVAPILGSIPWLVFSLALWFFPTIAAKKCLGQSSSSEVQSLSAVAMLTVLLSALSVYFLYYAVTDMVYWFSFWQLLQGLNSTSVYPTELSPDNMANIYATGFELFAAICVLLNAKKLASSLYNVSQ